MEDEGGPATFLEDEGARALVSFQSYGGLAAAGLAPRKTSQLEA